MTASAVPAAVPAAARATVHVTVAVPTYRRPDDLRALLPVLCHQAAEVTAGSAGRYAVDVLVVDNDPERGAAGVVAEAGGPGVCYAAEPTPGIAAVRNRAMDEAAGSRLLAFIDDDERPREQWLAALLDTWADSGAAAVSGRVLAEYAGQLDPWLEAGGFFVRRNLPSGTGIDTAAAGNLLLDLDQVRACGTRFESALGLGGGEDTLFSRSLARAGGRMVWCAESAVVDQVPAERMTRRWVLTRAWSHGNGAVLTELRLTAGTAPRLAVRARGLVRGLLRMAGGTARWALGLLARAPRHRARGLRALCRGAGMVGGALGVVYQEYARGGRRWRLARLPEPRR
ncbi:GT2 family glycosyltransferase [Geodermatophilus tzadiensis]|uniref:GT2 family glycosyltransferase n=1 Tax=Geodermatophilus tzadiensis TaxID=1137988 RepID=A0A2T0TUH2_9ACTN|nr:glycosyltransferase [Geodermatophilus tzadiensis]PRY49344.1 GT2 family glycosyltransferase [Geodermatophilus tzadiensis]